MTDLVVSLKQARDNLRAISRPGAPSGASQLFGEAADEIERLRLALGNLICRINRDGGHAMTDDLLADAAAADLVAADRNCEVDELRAKVHRLQNECYKKCGVCEFDYGRAAPKEPQS